MELKAELEQLRDKSHSLQDTIQDMDHEIERAMHAIAAGSDNVGHAISVLTERHNAQLGLMFDHGKITARIEDLENRIREQDERVPEHDMAENWEARFSPTEDRLDWLRPTLEERDIDPTQDDRHPHYDREERMLEEMERVDRHPDDYLDWWTR